LDKLLGFTFHRRKIERSNVELRRLRKSKGQVKGARLELFFNAARATAGWEHRGVFVLWVAVCVIAYSAHRSLKFNSSQAPLIRLVLDTYLLACSKTSGERGPTRS